MIVNNKAPVFCRVFYFCSMEYMELDCRVTPGGENTEILIAYLGAIGYSMFEETEYGVKAYIDRNLFSQLELDGIPPLLEEATIEFKASEPEHKNWNEEWEKNFQPVIIGKDIYVRAEYHTPDPTARFELIIHPRMAFGTGHHATTSLVMEHMLSIDFKGKRVLDMGCGTGILAILAEKMGASEILAIDNDVNAVENTVVNCDINNATQVIAKHGDATTPGDEVFDIILANINRNIILEDLPLYTKNLAAGGTLITSGYYLEDLPMIREKAKSNNLSYTSHSSLDNWCRATFVKETSN